MTRAKCTFFRTHRPSAGARSRALPSCGWRREKIAPGAGHGRRVSVLILEGRLASTRTLLAPLRSVCRPPAIARVLGLRPGADGVFRHADPFGKETDNG